MNASITISRSAWKVKWLSNRTEADQGSKREGVYTTLESEQFMWMYYYQMHPLSGADRESNKFRKRESSEKINIESMEKGRWNRDTPESEIMSELVPKKLKKKAGKCTVMEPEAVSKTNNALLKAVVKHICGKVNWMKENMQV